MELQKFIIRATFKFLLIGVLIVGTIGCNKHTKVRLIAANDSERLKYAIETIQTVLSDIDYSVVSGDKFSVDDNTISIVVGNSSDSLIRTIKARINMSNSLGLKEEGFRINKVGNVILVEGGGNTGSLYGCLELGDRIKKLGELPYEISVSDQPEMKLRGAAIGMQKINILPDRKVYEYPYTPENFPWFYDKDLWVKYLDMLVSNRMNSLYLWNGHPFASLVRLSDYPYAVEVDSATFKMNEEIYDFITHEADKRGIYVIQMFYNIILSKPFADHHGLSTQERSREITPLVADYTQKSITEFITKYPNVGLLVCLGEAMHTIDDDVNWFTNTIIPGVKDGLQALGRTDEPPIILRGHDTDPKRVMDAALHVYSNLYTMQKYNGESLTTYNPRGPWTEIHKSLSNLGSVHIENVHILANLEPFRYSSPDFIQKVMKAMHSTHGANGLHLYPQASYWDWPYTADNTEERLLQIDRDWMWYETWARYAWNSNRGRDGEVAYWADKLGDIYGSDEVGLGILEAFEQTGEIAPKLLRRFGITDGNRQTLSLGMFMSQLINPHKWRIYPDFYKSNGPEGEILIEYAKKEWEGQPHIGETPPQIIAEVLMHAEMAVVAIDNAAPFVTKNRDEFIRLKNDVYCYHALAHFYVEKVKAAMHVLRYKYSNEIEDLENAIIPLEQSVIHFSRLVAHTQDAYLYANSMQTNMRRIPNDGTEGANKTWVELLPHYQDEFDNFKANLAKLKSGGNVNDIKESYKALQPIDVELVSGDGELYPLISKAKVYNDVDYSIAAITPELQQLKGVRVSYSDQLKNGTRIKFKCNQPVKVVVGYFNGHSFRLLNPPTLENNANANDRGQAEIRIANALDIEGLFPVNIYTYHFEKGENELILGKGIALILGFVDGATDIQMHDAGVVESEHGKIVDWLFY